MVPAEHLQWPLVEEEWRLDVQYRKIDSCLEQADSCAIPKLTGESISSSRPFNAMADEKLVVKDD